MNENKAESHISKMEDAAAEKARERVRAGIDAMTESDSMLGDAIPYEPDSRTEEEKVLSHGWEKSTATADFLSKSGAEAAKTGPNEASSDNPTEPTPDPKFSDVDLSKFHTSGAATGRLAEQPDSWTVTQKAPDDKPPSADDNETPAAVGQAEDRPERQKDPALEKAKAEWRERRDKANELEAEYEQKYAAYMQEESKSRLSRLAKLPRRMFGLKPVLSPELEYLRYQADEARAGFNSAAKELLTLKGERFSRSLTPKVAATLPFVHQQRLEAQRKAFDESWGKSKYLRPTLETLGKHKYTLTSGLVGVAAMSGFAVPVLAAVGAGMIAGKGTMEIGGKLFTMPTRRKLAEAREKVVGNYLERSYSELNGELEQLTFAVDAREARVKSASVAAAVAAGMAAGGYAAGSGTESGVVVDTPAPPEQADITPPAPETLPDEAPIPPRRPADFMGDAKVAEAMQPQVEAAIHEIESGARPEPEFRDPSDITPRPGESEVPIPTPRPEAAAELPDIKYTVVKGDNVWNILEGHTSDVNPIDGKSEVLRGMSLADRQAALDKLVEYYEAHPEEAIEAGVLKSNGNIHKIYPGENLNISMFDNKLRELLGIEGGLPENVPTPEPRAGMGTVTDVPVPEPRPDVVAPESTPVTPETAVTDINEMRIQEMLDLQRSVIAGDVQALERLEALGMDPRSLQGMVNDIFERGEGSVNGDLTLGEYLNSTRAAPVAPTVETPNNSAQNQPVPETTPYGEYDPFQDNSARVSEASFIPANDNADVEAPPAADQPTDPVADYVRSVEQGSGGFIEGLFGLGKSNISGTFESLGGYTFDQLREMASNDNWPEGVSKEAADRWIDEINKDVRTVAANDNETLGQYVARFANTRAV